MPPTIIITAAGRSQRFKDIGINQEKYMLQIQDQTMFDFALTSLSEFFDSQFIFILHKKHNGGEFVDKHCDFLGISDYELVEINEYTDGQATTALEADDKINAQESIAIFNIDTYITKGTLGPDAIRGDGYIPVFSAKGDRWSFVRTDAEDQAIEVSEKEKISDLATIGFYYFDEWELYKMAYQEASNSVKQAYGEKYVAPLYNILIDHGHSIYTDKIPADHVHVLGTPEDICKFYDRFPAEYEVDGLD